MTSNVINYFNNHKMIVALTAVFVVIGSKNLVSEMSEECIDIFKYHWIKKLVFFSILFIYTKEVYSSICISILIYLLFPKVFFLDTKQKC